MLLEEKNISKNELDRYCVTETIRRRTPILSDIRKARELLLPNWNTNYEEADSYILLGELDIMECNILDTENESDSSMYLESAKQYFYKALSVDDSKIQAYYGLFEAAIIEEDYEEAFLQLSNYEKKGNNRYCNFELMYQLLEELMEKKCVISSGDSRYIQNVEIDYAPLLANYHLAEGAFSNGDYKRVAKHLRICETLSFLKNLNLDFFPIQLLARKVLKKEEKNKKIALRKNFLETQSKGERVVLASELLSLDNTDIDSYFSLMDAYLDIKAYAPFAHYLVAAKALPESCERQESISLYERVVLEEMTNDSDMVKIDYLLKKGKALELQGLYGEAFTQYYYGYENYHYLYFLVKLANTCYHMENYGEAIKFATEYLEKGYASYVEATIILYKTYMKEGSQSIANRLAEDCYKKARMEERGKSLEEWLTDLHEEYQGEVGNTDFSPSKFEAKEYVNKRNVQKKVD